MLDIVEDGMGLLIHEGHNKKVLKPRKKPNL